MTDAVNPLQLISQRKTQMQWKIMWFYKTVCFFDRLHALLLTFWMKISLSNQEEGHTILCLARHVGGVGTKSKIFFVMQFYDEVFARTVLNLTLKRQFKVEGIRNFQENARNCILNR